MANLITTLKADYDKAVAKVKEDWNYIRRNKTLQEIEAYVGHLEGLLFEKTTKEAQVVQVAAPYSDNAPIVGDQPAPAAGDTPIV